MLELLAGKTLLDAVGDLVLVLILLTGVYTDVRWRRLPNRLTLGGAAAGLIVATLDRGVSGSIDTALGWLLGCALLFIPFALRGMGAGDVKMLAAIGAIQGPMFVLQAAVYMALAGGVQALAVLILRGALFPLLKAALHDLWFSLRCIAVYHRTPPFSSLTFQSTLGEAGTLGGANAGHGPSLPYGIAIAAGGLLALVLVG